jgi:hypothetical protein
MESSRAQADGEVANWRSRVGAGRAAGGAAGICLWAARPVICSSNELLPTGLRQDGTEPLTRCESWSESAPVRLRLWHLDSALAIIRSSVNLDV